MSKISSFGNKSENSGKVCGVNNESLRSSLHPEGEIPKDKSLSFSFSFFSFPIM